MKKFDNIFPELGFIPAWIITIVLGIALQLGGAWILMLMAGIIGSFFVRKTLRAFLVGFLGVGAAWTILFVYLSFTAQALVVGDYFIGLLGLTGLGWLVIVISILIGALLGGFGGLLGRSIIEVIDEFIPEDAGQSPAYDEG